MSIIAQGRLVEFLIFFATAIATVYYLWRAIKGHPQELRMLPQVEAISDGVDRAVETGKPVFVGPGANAWLWGQYALMTIAGMNITRYTLTLAVRKGARPILVGPHGTDVVILMDGIFREVCVREGKPEAYKREDVEFYAGQYSIGLTASLLRNGCACLVLVGGLGGGSDSCPAGVARMIGGLVVAGTPRVLHQGTFALFADFPLFMDDCFAAGALVSGDEVVKASLVGADVIKLVLVGVTIVFLVFALLRYPVMPSKIGWLML